MRIIENEIKEQVSNRIKQLLFNDNVTDYRNYETFYSKDNHPHQFLIWKLKFSDIDKEIFGQEMQDLREIQGHYSIPGACDIVTCSSIKKASYKFVALYKP